MSSDPKPNKLAAALVKWDGRQTLETVRQMVDLLRREGHSDAAARWARVANVMAMMLGEERRNVPFGSASACLAPRRSDPGERILVTEDDEDVRSLIEDTLMEEGYQVDATATVEGALAFLDTRPYDLLLTDGKLPDGSGLTVASEARRRGTKVLVFTGYAHELPRAELAPYAVVTKPADMEHLVEAVSRVIRN